MLRGKNTEIYPLICLMDCLFVGQNIIELSSVDSTNNYLIDLSQNTSLAEGTIVMAKEQTAGRGQRNNIWSSESGKSLCISLLLKPKLSSLSTAGSIQILQAGSESLLIHVY